MAQRLTTQPERLSYTRRDIDAIDAEVDGYISHFIPAIKNTSSSNIGRWFLRTAEAILDKFNYSVDMRFRQSNLRTVKELQAALDITELVSYIHAGVSSATADLTVSTLTGQAPVGGIPIAQYQQFTTGTAPIKNFLALESATVPEGATGIDALPVVQGQRVVDQVILASAAGQPGEIVRFPVAKTPHDYIEIKVDAVDFEGQQDLRESEYNDRHYYLSVDEDLYTTVHFGDGTYGAILSAGAVVTATYIKSLGESGNADRGSISKVGGGLSSLITVTNAEVASGGGDGDTVDDVKRKAPLQARTFYRASHEEDFEALAQSLVASVFDAKADVGVGPVVNLSIMPRGGGVASSTVLNDVSEKVEPRTIHGAHLNTKSLLSAHILIDLDVLLLSNKVNKSLARKQVFEAISSYKLNGDINSAGALYYRNLTIGRGLAFSDVSAILENLQDGELIDYVDYKVFTRYPTPIPAGTYTVAFDGDIVPNSPCEYDTWSIQAYTDTTFRVYKNGDLDSTGTIGVTHTTDDGSLTFTLGKTSDTFSGGEQWDFNSSAYRNNMRLSSLEFMELARDSDFGITIYYPGELTIGS